MKKITLKNFIYAFALISAASLQGQVVYLETFSSNLGTTNASNGSNANWIWTSTCARSSMSGHSTSGSAFFQGSGCNFGNGGSTVSGNLNTPTIAISQFGANLDFNYYLENECGSYGYPCSYDVLSLQISTNGGGSYTTLMTSDYGIGGLTNGSSWNNVVYNLSAYAGQTVTIRFNFNSQDGIGNSYDGAYIDDIRIENIPPCNSAPGTNSIVASQTLLCPGYGVAQFNMANSYTVGGITYQWYASTTSSLGTFTPINSATLSSFVTPTLGVNTWYQVILTCAPTSQTYAPVVLAMSVSPTTTGTVPYYESFEGVVLDDQLPNCSWTASTPTTVCQTYTSTQNQNRSARTGSKFGAFYCYYTSGYHYFYTNGIQMHPGITYSASLWYKTENYGYTNVSDLSILAGLSQTTTGQFTIVSTNGPATSNSYKSLSGIFTVPTAGLYYVAVRMQGTGSYGVSYLSWDDLEIIIPCSLNSPTVNLTTPSNTVCAGEPITLTASGADTYSWSLGSTGSTLVDVPFYTTTYDVIGTSSLSGCPSQASQLVVVNPSPQVAIFVSDPIICAGKNVILTAFGAGSYTWSANNSSNNSMITVSPTITTNYTVTGSNSWSCKTSMVQQIKVNPNPVISVNVSPQSATTKICKGEIVTLTGSGAASYSWAATTLFIQSSQAQITPNSNTTYTVSGADVNGCVGTAVYTQIVDACTGINEAGSSLAGLSIYPNPTAGLFTVELSNGSSKTIQVIDLTGRVVYTSTSSDSKINVNISSLANGIYYVKIQSLDKIEVLKMVKE